MSAQRPNLLQFDLSTEDIAQRTDALIARSKDVLDTVGALPAGSRTFDNVVMAIALDEAHFETESSNLTFLSYVSTSKEVRDASTEANKKLEAFSIESMMREDIYAALSEVDANVKADREQIDADQRRLLDDMVRQLRRNGLHLPAEQRDQIKQIKTQISEKCIEFQQNLSEDKTELHVSREELDGMPDDFISGLQTAADDSGKYILTMKYPHLIPVMRMCRVESTRRQMDVLNGQKCMDTNTRLLEEIVALRQKEANLLGYETHADYVLEIRMAKTPSKVMEFLEDLCARLESKALEEMDHLVDLKRRELESRGAPVDAVIHSHDFNYYNNMLLETQYEVDHELIKEYFPAKRVTDAILNMYSVLLSLRFEELKDDARHVWHEDVRQYAVYDRADNDRFVGHFYLDLYPRDGKYTHAAAFPLQVGYVNAAGQLQPVAAAMVANFSPPTAGKPSLLKHDEVVTFAHEMGHLFHNLVSKAKYARFSGTRVMRDAVELPSQAQEQWCWEADFLKDISGHYTDESRKLPDDVITKLIASKNVNAGLMNRRQLFFGFFDMNLHYLHFKERGAGAPPPDTGRLWAELRKKITLLEQPPNTNPAASFGHLTGGYSSGYYGYLWSEVFCMDVYSRFKKEGIMNASLGLEYREKVLARGNMADPDVLLRDFLGREPSNRAFLEDLGIIEAA